MVDIISVHPRYAKTDVDTITTTTCQSQVGGGRTGSDLESCA